MAAAGSGVLADSGCKGPGAWLLRGCGLCFPVLGQVGRQRGKKGGRAMENKGCFLEGESEPVWQGKCGSVSGGRFGVCIQGSRQRRFSIGCSGAPPTTPFRFETRVSSSLTSLSLPTLSAGGTLSSPESLVTFPGTVTTANLLWHFLLLAARPDQHHAGVVCAGQAGTCRQGGQP